MAGRFSKTVRRVLVRTSLATVVFASATCYAYRPRGSWEAEYFKKMVRGQRRSELHMWPYRLAQRALLTRGARFRAHKCVLMCVAHQRGRQPAKSAPERWLANVGQAIAVGSTSACACVTVSSRGTRWH